MAYSNYRTNNGFVATARILFWGFSFVILLQAVFKHKYGKGKSVRLYIDPILLVLNKQLFFVVLANKVLAVDLKDELLNFSGSSFHLLQIKLS